jgi:hypothetical protein
MRLQVLSSPSSAVKMKLPMPAVEARWGFFVKLQGVLLLLSWPALVARRSRSVAY